MTDIEAREFHLAGWVRRSGVWATLGFLGFAVLAFWWRARHGLLPGQEPRILILAGLSFVFLIWAWHWRIRVGDQGIWRRRLIHWELWSWDRFGSGELKRGPGTYSYTDPARRAWNRTLSFELLDPEDRDFLMETCAQIWVPPPLPPRPERLEIQKTWKRKIELSPKGIAFQRPQNERFYPWEEVIELLIRRPTHEHRDFSYLELALPDRKIKFTQARQYGQTQRSWSGPDGEAISRYVKQYVPDEKTFDLAAVGPPLTIHEADRRLANLAKERKEQVRGLSVVGLICLGCLVAAFANGLILLIFPVACLPTLVPMLVCNIRGLSKNLRQLETWREELRQKEIRNP